MDTFKLRRRLLTEWARYLRDAAHGGHLGGRPIPLKQIRAVAGPRAGALELSAGLNAGRLLRSLAADDYASLRQLVPFDFRGSPAAFLSGRYVRIEAGWPDDLSESVIPLQTLGRHPVGGGRWIAGKNELGQTITLGLTDQTPHFLLAGQTGSGKSVGMLSAACQLGRDPDTHLIMMDGKYGVDLRQVSHLPTVGPLVTDCEAALAAMSWAIGDMKRRYEHRDDPSRLVILFDEPQTWLAESNALVAMTRRLLAQGRGANVHMVMSTQHPVVSAFGDSTSKRNLTGRVALRVADFEASRVAVGGANPRADHLLGAGDAYLVTPGATHRAQLAYVDRHDFDELPSGAPAMDEWPEFEPEELGQSPDPFTPDQTAEGIIAAHEGIGRPTLEKRAEVGSTVGRKLLAYGREVYAGLQRRKYGLCAHEVGWLGSGHTPIPGEDSYERADPGVSGTNQPTSQ